MAISIMDGATLTPASANHIGISKDGVTYDHIPKPGTTIGQIFSASPGLNYPYPTKTILVIEQHGNAMMYELQDIKTGDLLAYNTGTAANLRDAANLVAHWVMNV